MFSSITSYIWGQEEGDKVATLPHSKEVEDWIVVGGGTAADTFSNIDDDKLEQGEKTTAKQHRPHTQFKTHRLAKQEVHSAMFGHPTSQDWMVSNRALSRSNMTAMGWGGKKQQAKQNFNIKMAGLNKNLKQC